MGDYHAIASGHRTVAMAFVTHLPEDIDAAAAVEYKLDGKLEGKSKAS